MGRQGFGRSRAQVPSHPDELNGEVGEGRCAGVRQADGCTMTLYLAKVCLARNNHSQGLNRLLHHLSFLETTEKELETNVTLKKKDTKRKTQATGKGKNDRKIKKQNHGKKRNRYCDRYFFSIAEKHIMFWCYFFSIKMEIDRCSNLLLVKLSAAMAEDLNSLSSWFT